MLAKSCVLCVFSHDGDCDDHAAGEIRREAHRPMERISGFMESVTCYYIVVVELN